MAFAVRLGFEIEAVESLLLDRDGNLRNPTPGEAGAWDSVRLTLRKGERKVLVDYVRMNLSNTMLERQAGIRKWIDHAAANPTLLKAASHHPQEPDFSILRNSILARAPSIVQDETGIDYGALTEGFTVRLYGRFTKPNRAFSQDFQRTLAAAYRGKALVKPLLFRLGYEKDAGSALQVATRTAVAQARTCNELESRYTRTQR